jgi:hypothetical protein
VRLLVPLLEFNQALDVTELPERVLGGEGTDADLTFKQVFAQAERTAREKAELDRIRVESCGIDQ